MIRNHESPGQSRTPVGTRKGFVFESVVERDLHQKYTNVNKWHAPACTRMHRHAPACIGMHQLALACIMHRRALLASLARRAHKQNLHVQSSQAESSRAELREQNLSSAREDLSCELTYFLLYWFTHPFTFLFCKI